MVDVVSSRVVFFSNLLEARFKINKATAVNSPLKTAAALTKLRTILVLQTTTLAGRSTMQRSAEPIMMIVLVSICSALIGLVGKCTSRRSVFLAWLSK